MNTLEDLRRWAAKYRGNADDDIQKIVTRRREMEQFAQAVPLPSPPNAGPSIKLSPIFPSENEYSLYKDALTGFINCNFPDLRLNLPVFCHADIIPPDSGKLPIEQREDDAVPQSASLDQPGHDEQPADQQGEDDAVQKLVGVAPNIQSRKRDDSTGDSDSVKDRPAWFPKTKDGIEKWKKSYRKIQKKHKEYKESYANLDTKESKPSLDDLRDALAEMREWKKKPSTSTVHRIGQAGDNGWLG